MGLGFYKRQTESLASSCFGFLPGTESLRGKQRNYKEPGDLLETGWEEKDRNKTKAKIPKLRVRGVRQLGGVLSREPSCEDSSGCPPNLTPDRVLRLATHCSRVFKELVLLSKSGNSGHLGVSSPRLERDIVCFCPDIVSINL